MRMDWSRWRGLGVTERVSPRFSELCGRADAVGGRAVNGILPGRETIATADPADRPALVDALLRDKVARVLGTAPDRLDGDRPLLQLGIDSLMAVELRNWIEGELQVDLPIVDLMRSPSVSGLAQLLARRLEAANTPAPGEPRSTGAPNGSANGQHSHFRLLPEAAPTDLLARINDLSSDQIDSLLAALLDENGTVLQSTAVGTSRS
jgi:aryl carrier-like protein